MFFARIALALLFTSLSVRALAQRGEAATARPRETAVSGFPGAFDTFVPDKDSFVFSGTFALNSVLPIVGLPVEYGVTENFSIGSNAALPLLWSAKSKSFGGKIRLRVPFSQNFVSAFTAWGYSIALPGGAMGEQSSVMNLGLFTAAASFFVSDRLWANALVARLDLKSTSGTEGASTYSSTLLTGSFLNFGGEYMLASWLGFRPGVFVPLVVTSASDGGAESGVSGGTTSLKAGSSGNDFTTWSFMLDFLPGSHWMISPGLLASDQGGASGYSFDISYRW